MNDGPRFAVVVGDTRRRQTRGGGCRSGLSGGNRHGVRVVNKPPRCLEAARHVAGVLPGAGLSMRSISTSRPRQAHRTSPRAVGPTPDELRPWQLIRRAPQPVWVITALFALMLAAWSVLAPLYHAADEPNHADAVMRLVEGKGWPSSETARVTDQGVGATAASPYGTKQRPLTLDTAPLTAAAAPGRDDRPTWKQLQALPGTSGR